MPTVRGTRLWNRVTVTLDNAEPTVVPHGLSHPDLDRDPSLVASIMVIPLPPTAAWEGIQLAGQPTAESVTFVNGGEAPIDVTILFWLPHTVIGPGDADD